MALEERVISLVQRLSEEASAGENFARSCAPFLKMAAALLGMDGAFLSLVIDREEVFIAAAGFELPALDLAPGLAAVEAGGLVVNAAPRRLSAGREGRSYFALPLRMAEITETAVLSFIGPEDRELGPSQRLALAEAAAREIRQARALLDQADRERELRLAVHLARERKMEAMGQLAGSVAHDFNNLLTVINGYTKRLLDRVGPNDPRRTDLDNVRAAGERAAQLTQQLLAIGRQQIMRAEVINLNEIITRTKQMFAGLLGEEIALALALDPALGALKVDPFQFEQVILNLVNNARDAMPQGGRLLVETSNVELDEEYTSAHVDLAPGRYALLSVSDTGSGMTTEVMARIFEPFFTTKPKGQGTGLGLPAVFGIVKQSGGHIEVSSEPGRGSTFKIYLPITMELTGELTGEPPPASAPLGQGSGLATPGAPNAETILLVEDDERVRNFTTSVLRDLGYRVIPAAESDEARAAVAATAEIDLLLIDVVLPKTSGHKLAAELLLGRPGMKTLFISGYTRQALLARGEIAEDAAFLQKPFTVEVLSASVRAALDGARQRPDAAPGGALPGTIPSIESDVRPNVRASILVVDDEAAVRDYLAQMLSEAGFAVTAVGDGDKALKIYRQSPTDLVLMDLVMPEREGIETIQMLRHEFPQAKIIAMSGAVGGPILSAARMLGANEILQKPIDPQELVEMLRRMMGEG